MMYDANEYILMYAVVASLSGVLPVVPVVLSLSYADVDVAVVVACCCCCC